ncbi:trans-aconitate 2-methyltransferase [Rhizobium sp. RU20A]|uniref:trans-aconitate 2-methyltransferase n=1 Tax=Rhizobium sp. RU20A TaxID=1907412 RepID=UPI0009555BF0|nr:trans-aconitate 2-methyltransferase [Rhizobium sp. RU20A]SIR17410.1 trans-aconitate 2-methyltransferase [Rhizobium sp. RU20A]
MTWSAAQYLKFEDQRTRPARDLLSAVPDLPEGAIYDLGCGPANSTALIVERFGAARVTGVDTAPDMLAAAAKRLPDCRFICADLSTWEPEAPAALFFANAVFQWVPDTLEVLAWLSDRLLPGGVLAVQMPDNLTEPSHAAMRETAAEARFAAHLADAERLRTPIPPPRRLFERLAGPDRQVDVWHTVYNHPLADTDAIVEWVKGTGLRPFLERLPAALVPAFTDAYRDRIAMSYPAMTDGRVLLRFPRLFLTVRRMPETP